jgi:protein TonB
VDAANLPPPPPPPEREPEKKSEPDDKPPELQPDATPLDLSQLELALNPGVSSGLLGGDFGVKLSTLAGNTGVGDVDALFSLADLDQKPRAIYQPGPNLDASLRRKLPAAVNIVFLVDQHGRVESPMVQSSTDPEFERPALAAIKQWRFEPGKRNGKEVRFRMRQPFTFPAGKQS